MKTASAGRASCQATINGKSLVTTGVAGRGRDGIPRRVEGGERNAIVLETDVPSHPGNRGVGGRVEIDVANRHAGIVTGQEARPTATAPQCDTEVIRSPGTVIRSGSGCRERS